MAQCKTCGGEVNWVNIGERWRCLNQNGEEHWDTCSKRVFDEVKRSGTHYIQKNGKETVHGYQSSRFGKKAYMREGTVTLGIGYKPTQHTATCNAAPWEDCTCKTSD